MVACLLSAGSVSVSQARSLAGLPDFSELVEKSSPAVVNISTTQKADDSKLSIPHGMNPSMEDFLKKFFGDNGPMGPHGDEDRKSLGSGFVISKDGYILTNTHVIKDADEVTVRLTDRREFPAKIIGSDDRSDVALLKIDADDLTVARIGKSADMKPGNWVLAIGSPFGLDHSVTAGIVSAIGRSLPNENYTPFIQTDVAINPGNSGGPLYNLDGEVVGINSQIYSRTGGYMGLSFAIPIDLAMNVIEQLKETGHVTRGWLGVLIQDVTRELAESFGMDKPKGALVARVMPDSPAEKAGFKVGDIIVKFKGREISRSSALPPIVGSSKVGGRVDVEIIRDAKPMTLSVTLSELPASEDLALNGTDGHAEHRIKRIGLVVSELTAEQKDKFSIDNGVYVESADEGSAARAGITQGDVIIQVNGADVTSTDQLAKIVDALPEDKPARILIQRDGSPRFLALRIAKND
ncbi:MAG: Do family serine endopeptidase [Gammaproteobacteria bacterium]|nr:Do family serine endopeptidase [Gammaproteobacteria bacterium]